MEPKHVWGQGTLCVLILYCVAYDMWQLCFWHIDCLAWCAATLFSRGRRVRGITRSPSNLTRSLCDDDDDDDEDVADYEDDDDDDGAWWWQSDFNICIHYLSGGVGKCFWTRSVSHGSSSFESVNPSSIFKTMSSMNPWAQAAPLTSSNWRHLAPKVGRSTRRPAHTVQRCFSWTI